MRVPPPGLLKLNRQDLLNDVRARLAEKYPDYADESDLDATDPAWIILEQAAWLVELLSEQLDQYPYSMVQEFVHMMGGKLNPALPSLGVACLHPAEAGEIKSNREKPSLWRFFTLQTEDMDMVEFTPIESKLHIRPNFIDSIVEIRDSELYCIGQAKGTDGIDLQEAWRSYSFASRVFDEEWVRYDLVSSNAQDLVDTLEKAIEALEERKLGWLEFRTEMISQERVSLFARVNLGKAFAQNHPSGLTDGNDVRGQWGTLDDSAWTPPVRVTSDPTLPPSLRGSAPLPGLRRGTIIVPGVPENYSVDELLQRKSMPLPASVVEAIWITLTHMDQKLSPLKPSIHRGVGEAPPEKEPKWVGQALDKGLWSEIVDRAVQRYIHINVKQANPTAGEFRIAMALKGVSEEHIPEMRVFGIESETGLQRVPLSHKVAWKLRLPDPMGGQRMVLVVAYDIKLGPEHEEILITTESNPICVMSNAALIANAPAVSDGRQIEIVRNIPEPVNLLFDDIVNADVVEHLLRDSIPSDTARILQRLPLAHFSINGSAPIFDYQGVWIDPTSPVGEGALIRLNAPDAQGEQRSLRPGKVVTLNWYRRTDGEFGNVMPGAIKVVEQPPTINPVVLNVHNPLATFFGTTREDEPEAIDRMFNPSGGVPVMPTDWERLFRVSLGVKARGWILRCWSHPERSLVSSVLWPIASTGFEVDRDAMRLQRMIANAGPETLLVSLGPTDRLLSDEELDWARGIIVGLVKRQMNRLPLIKKVIVTRFWPLKLECLEKDSDFPTPSFNIDDMNGVLVDINGKRSERPNSRLFLNAAVVDTEMVREVKL